MACEVGKVYMYIFSILCVIATMGMCGYWVYKFYLNEDSTLVNYKKFYQDEDDIYPTISLCLQNPFLKKELAKYGVSTNSVHSYVPLSRSCLRPFHTLAGLT